MQSDANGDQRNAPLPPRHHIHTTPATTDPTPRPPAPSTDTRRRIAGKLSRGEWRIGPMWRIGHQLRQVAVMGGQCRADR